MTPDGRLVPRVPDLFGSAAPEPTYASLLDADLATLEVATSEWQQVRDDLEVLSDTARRDLLGGVGRSGWRGENATVTAEFLTLTADKFRYAHEQAVAVHSLLETLHGDLLVGQDGLRRLEAAARERGVLIDARGAVHPLEHPEIGLEQVRLAGLVPLLDVDVDPATVRAMEDTQADIRRIVDTAAEADRLAARSLENLAEADDGVRFGHFGYQAAEQMYDALIAQDASAFVDLAGQEELSASDLYRMRNLMEDHADDPDFGAQIVDRLGMDEYLRLADRMDRSATQLNSDPQLAAELRAGMGTTLTTVLRPPAELADAPYTSSRFEQWLTTPAGQDYQRRMDAFHTAGAARLHSTDSLVWDHPDRRLGFDVALDLLNASEEPMSRQLFAQTADHMRELERENPDIWAGDRFPSDPSDPDYNMFVDPWDPENDALDRLLGVGAHNNPDAVTAYFNPGEADENGDRRYEDRLRYFIGDSRSPGADYGDHRHVETPAVNSPFAQLMTTTPPGPGLTAALEAAATGLSPGEVPAGPREHSQAQINVAEAVWNTFSGEYASQPEVGDNRPTRIADDEPFANLRPALGAIAADYMPDVQFALSHESDTWRPEPFATFDTDHAALMLHDIGMDPEAYVAITAANEAHAHVSIDAAVNEPVDDNDARRTHVEHAVAGTGQLAAIMTDARNTATVEGHVESDEQFNATLGQVETWTGVVFSIAEAPLAERFPIAGTAVSELRGVVTEAVFNSMERNSEIAANTQADRVTQEVRGEYMSSTLPSAVLDAVARGDLSLTATEADHLVSGAATSFDISFGNGLTKTPGQ